MGLPSNPFREHLVGQSLKPELKLRGTIPTRLVGDAAEIPELRAALKRFELALVAELRRRAPHGENSQAEHMAGGDNIR